MPAPLDLTGRQFGRLTVLERGERVRFGRWQQGWVCRCECGAVLTVPQDRLPHRPSVPANHVVDACPACRGNPCAVCGANIPLSGTGHGRPVTCSSACADAHRKARGRAGWQRRSTRDPELARRMAQRRRERASADPEYAERVKAWQRRREQRRRERAATDPEYAERLRQWRAEHWLRNAQTILARRRARVAAMSPEEKARWLEQSRRHTRRWAEKIRNDPVLGPLYVEQQRSYRERRRAAEFAARLAALESVLLRRLEDTHES